MCDCYFSFFFLFVYTTCRGFYIRITREHIFTLFFWNAFVSHEIPSILFDVKHFFICFSVLVTNNVRPISRICSANILLNSTNASDRRKPVCVHVCGGHDICVGGIILKKDMRMWCVPHIWLIMRYSAVWRSGIISFLHGLLQPD